MKHSLVETGEKQIAKKEALQKGHRNRKNHELKSSQEYYELRGSLLDAKHSLVLEVKRAVELALKESNWGSKNFKQKRVIITEKPKIKGDSELSWAPDLAVVDRNFEVVYSVIFCIHTKWSVAQIENTLNKALVCSEDLAHLNSLPLVIVKNDNSLEGRVGQRFVSRYENLVASDGLRGIKIVQWNPRNIHDFIRGILSDIKEKHPERWGIKSIKDTLASLSQKYPNLFPYMIAVMPKKETKCAELLKEIKEQDPYLSYGKIISHAIQRKGIDELQAGISLNYVSDASLEKLLKRYLDIQR